MIGYDVAKNQPFFDRMWKMVVAWNVYCAKIFGYDNNWGRIMDGHAMMDKMASLLAGVGAK